MEIKDEVNGSISRLRDDIFNQFKARTSEIENLMVNKMELYIETDQQEHKHLYNAAKKELGEIDTLKQQIISLVHSTARKLSLLEYRQNKEV